MVYYRICSEVRSCRVFITHDLLRQALNEYSRGFICTSFGDSHSYFLFHKNPSLVSVTYYSKVNPLLSSNMLAVFTSSSEETSRNLAERFEEKTELELLTESEDPILSYISIEKQESIFMNFLSLLAIQPSLVR